MNRIVECVPNFSEGRRPETIEAIVRAIAGVADVIVLDHQMDADHNRAVVTIVGSPESIGEAALRGVAAAAQHIDLTTHRGEHPRIGATDVLPFIPIRGVTLEECVAIARATGQRIAEELDIPVFFYGAAATCPERVKLEHIRRGQFELLQSEMAANPARRPDLGRHQIHPTAGAIAIGARKPLIAYNINLNTADVRIAKEIAKQVRSSSGGLEHVKALGIFLKDRNQAQVSMNLTDHEQTPIGLVFETVRRAAEQLGVEVAGSEIVGLIPQRALDQAAESFLKIEQFAPSMILENRLAQMLPSRLDHDSESIRSFVAQVASAEPTPGGSSVTALTGAFGAALGEMAIRATANLITADMNHYRTTVERCADALDRLAPYRSAMLDMIDTGTDAVHQVTNTYRDMAVQDMRIRATEIPSRTANCAAETLRILEAIRPIIDASVAPDLLVGLGMLRAALRGAIAGMRVNLLQVPDAQMRLRYEDMITGWEQHLKG